MVAAAAVIFGRRANEDASGRVWTRFVFGDPISLNGA